MAERGLSAAGGPEPRSELRRLRAVAVARGLGGLASQTKWMELVHACHAMDGAGPHYRRKRIDDDEPGALAADWFAIPFPTRAIEWLDVFPLERRSRGGRLLPVEVIDHSPEIEAALKRIGLDYRKGAECIRVFGYAPRDEVGFVPAPAAPR